MIKENPKKKILIADDSPTIREILKNILQERGFEVFTAKDGIEALRKVYSTPPNLIILDIAMPRMKGYQVSRFLKADKTTQHIPIIILSVKKGREDIFWAKDCGADIYFSKDSDQNSFFEREKLSNFISVVEDIIKKSPVKEISNKDISEEEVLSSVNELLDEELRKSRLLSKRLSFIFELSNHLLSQIELEKLYTEILEISSKLLDADSGSLMILDEPTKKLKIAVSFGIDEKAAQGVNINLGEGISGWVAAHKKPLLLKGGLEKNPLFSHLKTRHEINSSICVPLLVDEKLKGVLNLNILKPKMGFQDKDLEFAMILANFLAALIERAGLHKRLKDTLEALENTQAQLIQAEKFSTLGRFAAGIAHEIRNPLAIISAEAQYLLQKKEWEEQLSESTSSIISQCDRISEIIERLLEFSHPSKKIKAVDIEYTIDKTLDFVRYQVNVEKVRIIKKFQKALPLVKGDPTQLQEVFLNLILNAVEAMPEGGNLEIEAKRIDSHICIRFTDTGRGIPEERLKDIFESFFTTKEKGLGLGLFISNQIVRSLDGWMEVESKPACGTSFRVYLQIIQGE